MFTYRGAKGQWTFPQKQCKSAENADPSLELNTYPPSYLRGQDRRIARAHKFKTSRGNIVRHYLKNKQKTVEQNLSKTVTFEFYIQ